MERLEAERKLRCIPAPLLESSWVLDAQTQAVVDALLVCSTSADDRAYAHARHVGEWSARIAAEVPCAPEPAFMRRCGVLADVEPVVLERIPEVRDCAPVVSAYQRLEMSGDVLGGFETAAARIIAVAGEFDSLISTADAERRYAPADALRMMARTAGEQKRPLVNALRAAMRTAPAYLFDTVA